MLPNSSPTSGPPEVVFLGAPVLKSRASWFEKVPPPNQSGWTRVLYRSHPGQGLGFMDLPASNQLSMYASAGQLRSVEVFFLLEFLTVAIWVMVSLLLNVI